MKTFVLCIGNMPQVQALLDPIINGEASFAESDFFDPNHPHTDKWLGKENRIASRVENHWMFEQHQQTGVRHHSDKPETASLFRLHCHAISSEILHAGDILHFIDSKIVVIERNYLMANTKGKFLKITMVRKFEELTKEETTEAAWLEIEMDTMQVAHSLWNQQKADEEEQKEREAENISSFLVHQSSSWATEKFNELFYSEAENWE
ncbi:MAG: hypothetical protein K9M36_02025 [Candidatus Pacebacteria bacterium]|nr:hypothetical protein [Candidatus Paceibacterota bacterium]